MSINYSPVETTSTISYTVGGLIKQLGNIRYDITAPTVVNVLTRNVSNANSINPWIRGGDRINFEVESSEPLYLSRYIGDNNDYIGYGDKIIPNCTFTEIQFQNQKTGNTLCDSNWVNSKVQYFDAQINTNGVEKIYYPTFSLEDYAGNQAKYTNPKNDLVNYSITPRSKSLDYRLFIDNTFPDKTGIDTSKFDDKLDGISADGINPEVDRLPESGIRYIIRGTQLTLKIQAKKYSRVILNSGDGKFTTLNPNSTLEGCPKDGVANTTLVTKYNTLCEYTYVYNWTGTGLQDPVTAEAKDYKSFSVTVLDLAGNPSIESQAVSVYNDREGAKAPSVYPYRSDNGKSIFEDAINTNQLKLREVGETKADVETVMTDPKGLVTKKISRNGYDIDEINNFTKTTDNQESNIKLNLGSATKDVNYKMVGLRRVGIDSDGYYRFDVRNTDTAGNNGGIKTINIERDTMSPNIPLVVGTADENNFKYSIKIIGEPNTFAEVDGSTYSKVRLDANGVGNIQIISNNTYRYNTQYNWNVYNTDIAGNRSTGKIISFKTKTAPIITTDVCIAKTADKISYPFAGIYVITSNYGYRDESSWGGDNNHPGVDYNLNFGTDVLAAKEGTITSTRFEKEAGYVIEITHTSGLKSLYAHLSQFLAKVGDNVARGQIIAKSGKSGQVTGAHLHFQLSVNGVIVNPLNYLENCTPTTPPTNSNEDEISNTVILCDTPIVYDFNKLYPGKNVILNDPKYCKQETGNTKETITNLTGKDIASQISFGKEVEDQIAKLGDSGKEFMDGVKSGIVECILSTSKESKLTESEKESWGYKLRSWGEFAFGFVPWAGDAYDGYVATTGNNWISGEEADCVDRTVRGAASAIGLGLSLAASGTTAASGATTGCVVSAEVGCAPGAVVGGALGALVGFLAGNGTGETVEKASVPLLRSMVKEAGERIIKEQSKEVIEKVLVRTAGQFLYNKRVLGNVLVDGAKLIFTVEGKLALKATGKELIIHPLVTLAKKFAWAASETTWHILRGFVTRGKAFGGHGMRGLLDGTVKVTGLKDMSGNIVKTCTNNVQECIDFMKANPSKVYQGLGTTIDGIAKNSHTFFPSDWSEEYIMSTINRILQTSTAINTRGGNLAKYMVIGEEFGKKLYHVVIYGTDGIVKTSYILDNLTNL